jgi:RNA polymerase sigma-70 factor, ECF subfamily
MKGMAAAPEVQPPPAASETAERLFQEHSGWIYGYCLRILRSPEEAEDALQTTYLNACRSLNQGTRPRAGSAWLLRIARNVCLERIRSAGRRGRLERVQDITVLEETVAAPDRPHEALIGLTDALLGMPEQQRRAVLLREWKGLSHREIAEELGLTQAAVEALIFRGRRSLAAALENPEKRRRLRSVHALDLGGSLAAIKSLLAGGAGVKAAVALTVATAATATVVAADPAHVWRDRPAQQVPARAAGDHASPSNAGAAAAATSAVAIVAPAEETRRPAGPGPESAAESERGRTFGQTTSAAAKTKAKGKGGAQGNGRADAPGQANRPEPPQPGSNGRGPAASGKPESPGQGGPPAQAKGPPPQAQGPEKSSARSA